jgi:hypothetical protein
MKNITPIINNSLSFLNSINQLFDQKVKDISLNRNRKIANKDLLLFSLLYTDLNATQLSVSDNIKLHNNISFDVTSIVKKINNVNIDVYSNLHNCIYTYYAKTFKKKNEYLAIDGVYNNTNVLHNGKLETNMNLCVYDVINNYPIDIIYSDVGKKNNESKILEQHIENNKNSYTNKCLICDRAYFSYGLFEYLHSNNIKFIIRVKRNIATQNKYPYLRIIKRHYVKSKDQQVIIATNISTETKDATILKLYSKRWNIEEYFKHLKSNNKFQNITLESANKLQKHYYSIQIINLIKQILIDLYKYRTKYKEKIIKTKDNKKYKTHINETHIMDVLYTHFIYDIVNGTFDKNKLIKFINTVKINTNLINVHNERISKIPFTKWYIKSYHNKDNNMIETYSRKIKQSDDIELKQQLKTLIKEESNIKRKRKEVLKKYFNK